MYSIPLYTLLVCYSPVCYNLFEMHFAAEEEGAGGGGPETTVVYQYATRSTAKAAQTNLIKEILQDIQYRRDPHMIVEKATRMTKIFAGIQELDNAHIDDLLSKKGPGEKPSVDEVQYEKKWIQIQVATADFDGACTRIHDHLDKVKAAMQAASKGARPKDPTVVKTIAETVPRALSISSSTKRRMTPEELEKYMEKRRARVKEELEAAHAIEEKELELRDVKRKAKAAKEMNEIEDQLERVALADNDSQKLSEDEEEEEVEDPQGLFGGGGSAFNPFDAAAADDAALAAVRASMAATAAHVDPFAFVAPQNPLGPFRHPPPGGGGNPGGGGGLFPPPSGGGTQRVASWIQQHATAPVQPWMAGALLQLVPKHKLDTFDGDPRANHQFI